MGIIVPIVFVLTTMLVSWISGDKDMRIGNAHLTGWGAFWSAIILTLVGLALLGKSTDENGNEVRKKHDFFWIPVVAWGVILGVLSAYLLIWGQKPADAGSASDASSSAPSGASAAPAGPAVERVVHFYNPGKDTLLFEVADSAAVSDENTDGVIERKRVAPRSTRSSHYPAGSYIFAGFDQQGDIHQMIPDEDDLGDMGRYESFKGKDGKKYQHRILGAPTPENDDYDEAWVVLDGKTGMLLVNVSTACAEDVDKAAVLKADWTASIQEEYAAGDIIEPLYKKFQKDKNIRVVGPGQKLPHSIADNEIYYLLVPKVGKMDNKAIGQAVVEARF